MSILMLYLARHYISGALGLGPSYKLVIVQEAASKGLQQVSNCGSIVGLSTMYTCRVVKIWPYRTNSIACFCFGPKRREGGGRMVHVQVQVTWTETETNAQSAFAGAL
jgi:hypothetical protein